MKSGSRIVKLVDQSGNTDGNAQTGFFMNFAGQILWQRSAIFHTAAWRTPQIRLASGKGVHQQQTILVQDQGACRKSGEAFVHDNTLRRDGRFVYPRCRASFPRGGRNPIPAQSGLRVML
jgi:hypothetical protein